MADCSRDGCVRAAAVRGMCQSHYTIAWRHNREAWSAEPKVNAGNGCSVDGCEKPARKRGWCHMHYQRWRQHGDANYERPVVDMSCVRCGAEKHRSASGKLYCPSCSAASNKRNREANGDAYSEQRREHYQRTREEHAARNRKRYEADKDAWNAQVRRWQLAHPDKKRQYSRTWYERNREQAYANVARYRARRLEAICEHGPTCVTPDVLSAVRSQLCIYCAAPAEHADHYIPLTKGGLHCRQNIVPACRPCNQSKNNRLPNEWRGVAS